MQFNRLLIEKGDALVMATAAYRVLTDSRSINYRQKDSGQSSMQGWKRSQTTVVLSQR